MNRSEYCLKKCGGKCCTIRVQDGTRVRCSHQKANGACGIYEHRFADGAPNLQMVGLYKIGAKTYPFMCGKIEYLIANDMLPEELKDRCCYVHPELLESK